MCGARIFIFSAGIRHSPLLLIDLGPFGKSKLSSAHERQRQQLERETRLWLAVIGRDVSHQFRHLGFGNAAHVCDATSLQRTSQIRRRVTLRLPGRHSEPEHLAGCLQRLAGQLQRVTTFDFPNDCEKLRRRDFLYRPGAE
jgi:hypothetical protein